ncbi:MAG: hypothetical protein EDX89_03435 [Acidobacteria bacterium]|nr:MAG: hypothetical protein EDX89_03435 [Acidobacteriota bacterium]MCE7957178.1 hypothetical protein [Acidobacteria bacterium ACB2]
MTAALEERTVAQATPWRAATAKRSGRLVTTAYRSEKATKAEQPRTSARLRPKWSATAPASGAASAQAHV